MSLTNEQVLEIRKSCGWNEIIPSNRESSLSELKHIFTDPMGLMLLSLGIIYLLVGKTTDATVLLISFIPVTAVDVVLELRAKKALNALKATLKPTAKVIRESKIIEIPIREIVTGDTIVFEEGQSLPADGKVIESEQLQINEAALTGESLPVEKNIEASFLSGTVILQGRGSGIVEKIGRETKFGNIAKLLEETEAESSPLKKKINSIVKRVLWIAVFISIILFVITLIQNNNWAQSLIEALTFGMAAIPEEFPLVFTLYLSMGAYRLSKHGVLIKSLPSVEALGGVDVICTDKTGTLTEGKFKLELLDTFNNNIPVETLWQAALMGCEEKAVDAMDIAIFDKGIEYKNQLSDWTLKWDYPFETKGKHMSHIWINKSSSNELIAMKGSVEGLLEHCNLDDNSKNRINEQVSMWSSKGKRLLGLASRSGKFTGNRIDDEKDLEFIGFLIFSDPIRPSAKAAVENCQQSGILIKMLTGDHPLTAHAIADELNLVHQHEYLFNGDQLSKMTKEERWHAYQQGAIFSRVLPEQKYEMVLALKEAGKVVAMTGDGINDAPALKIADIGISMGENATDVARSSSQMVLMKNDFQGIVEAVIEGRRIFCNLKRSFSYLISFHVPIIFFAFVPPLLKLGSLLMPIHIVLLELIVHPVSAFAFENLPATHDTTSKKLMTKSVFLESLFSGVLLSIGSLLLYHHVLDSNNVISARSIAIAAIMFGNIFFVLVESWPKITLRFVMISTCLIIFLLVILKVEYMARILYLTNISDLALLQAAGIGLLASVPTFILKIFIH